MTTHPVYDRILSSITDQTVMDVYTTIRDYVGESHRITKESVSLVLWGKYTPSTDRTIRECVETLHSVYGVPICTDSGKAGYYMAATREELAGWITEHRSRAHRELEAVSKVENNCNIWFTMHDAPQVFTKPAHHIPASVEQAELFPAKRVEYA
jgi:hypothetical protein